MFAAATPFALPARARTTLDPAVADDVYAGLTRKGQKTLPASLLYDAVGSALFEVITLLPEYGLTRADAQLLSRKSGEIVRAAGSPQRIVELGSGTGSKTRHILEASAKSAAAAKKAAAAKRNAIRYSPIDISAAALEQCSRALGSLPRVAIEPIEANYLDGLKKSVSGRSAGDRILLLFLGSTIGNFSRAEAVTFLRKLRAILRPGDTLLLGTDLVKPAAKLISAYADSIGATAAFNLNLLARINRELGGNFVLPRFAHEARWNQRSSRVEMHLRSLQAQQVRIEAFELDVSFAAGETIWTESSHKFRAQDIPAIAERAGWSARRQWLDSDWGFAETLLEIPAE